MKKVILVIVVILAVVGGWLYFVKGYAGIRKRPAVPEALACKARIPGMKTVRIMVDPIKIKKSALRATIYDSGLTEVSSYSAMSCLPRRLFPWRFLPS